MPDLEQDHVSFVSRAGDVDYFPPTYPYYLKSNSTVKTSHIDARVIYLLRSSSWLPLLPTLAPTSEHGE